MKVKNITLIFIFCLIIITVLFSITKDMAFLNGNDGDKEPPFSLLKNESLNFLRYGLPIKDVIKNLGQPEEQTEIVVWGADGLEHQSWYYHTKGIKLDVVNQVIGKKQRIVNMIVIKHPCSYRTKRNIGIGSAKNEVVEAYKDEIDYQMSTDSYLIAGSIYGGVCFTMENDLVASIFIGAGAE
jgi:hypothetical protein